MKSFRLGGIHPHDNKISNGSAIQRFEPMGSVTISMSQHIGSPATPIVDKGDVVMIGDRIGESSGFVSANIHSSVSGVVTSVGMVPDGGGVLKMAVTIDTTNHEQRFNDQVDTTPQLVRQCTLSPTEIVAKIAKMGIVGMGGATFPTHIKLTPPPGKTASILIVNGVECEPYLTSDHRLMLEHADELLVACGIVMRALGVDRCVIGVENNKPDAIANLQKVLAQGDFAPSIMVMPLKMRYPQGGEKQLVSAVTGREIQSGQLPIEVGAVVQNVSTMYAIYQAVQKNQPLVSRIVTVTGWSVARPSNLLVPIGTPISALLAHCMGQENITTDTTTYCKVINGGPMMGRAMSNLESAVSKGCSGILVIDGKKATRPIEAPCISCAKCVGACPMGLEPYLLSKIAKHGLFDRLEEERITDCIECGCCSFTCPSNLPLLDYIRLGKVETMKLIRSRKK